MRATVVAVALLALLGGCGGSGPAAVTSAPQALAAYSPMYYPVAVGVSYMIPTGAFEDTIRFELNYTHVLDPRWELLLSAGYAMYTWDNGWGTKSASFPVVIGARYRQEMLSGASWYAGLGVGWSFNDLGDMEGSFLSRVTLGLEQPVATESLNMLVRLEAGYDYSKADAKWGATSQHDLSNISIGLHLVFLL